KQCRLRLQSEVFEVQLVSWRQSDQLGTIAAFEKMKSVLHRGGRGEPVRTWCGAALQDSQFMQALLSQIPVPLHEQPVGPDGHEQIVLQDVLSNTRLLLQTVDPRLDRL